MHRRTGSLQAVRHPGGFCSIRPSLHAETPRDHLPEKEGGQSQQARAEAKDQPFRFPRPCRLERYAFRFCFAGLADQFLVHKPLAHDLRDSQIEPVTIGHVLPVGVNLSVNIRFGVIDDYRLASVCNTYQEKLIAWTLLDTGLRVAELANLTKDNLDWQGHRLMIYGKGGPYGTRSKRRVIQLTARVQPLLEGHCALHDTLDLSVRTVQRSAGTNNVRFVTRRLAGSKIC